LPEKRGRSKRQKKKNLQRGYGEKLRENGGIQLSTVFKRDEKWGGELNRGSRGKHTSPATDGGGMKGGNGKGGDREACHKDLAKVPKKKKRKLDDKVKGNATLSGELGSVEVQPGGRKKTWASDHIDNKQSRGRKITH